MTAVLIKDAALRAELEALIAEHAYRLDMNCSENLAELYTDDGCFIAPGFACEGPDAINAYGRDRAAAKDRRVRHVCTNFRFWEDGPDQARGVCFILLFRSNGPDLTPAEPIALADAHDIYRRCPDGVWRLKERRVVLSFESAAHKSR
ncbi:SnoaL-like protein [Hephaestia caeni]|jgi:hypothetical protein|uniref:SnoaL-like protein n=1 Tax=Hephaestia caeni TaxID=645617 RepID=A0A397PDU8_9SPHN|nr:nuclear transport factor 2 family protein [Hephaestia caeni]RIA44334.1 SnoaL-like protein [Hephaestia caeni]